MPFAPNFERVIEALAEIKNLLAEMNKYRFADQYLDNNEFTKVLKISKKTAQLWRDSGLIPYAQIGKKIYYRLSDLEKHFENEFNKGKRLKKVAAPKRTRLKQSPKTNGWSIKV